MAIASYARLNDGNWGVRVKGQVNPGDRLSVCMRSGRAKAEVVDRVLWRGDNVALCSLIQKKKRAPRAKAAM
jgi:hypothetical protein